MEKILSFSTNCGTLCGFLTMFTGTPGIFDNFTSWGINNLPLSMTTTISYLYYTVHLQPTLNGPSKVNIPQNSELRNLFNIIHVFMCALMLPYLNTLGVLNN